MRTPTPPNPNEIPLIERLRAKTAGRYVVHAELGVGGMATVFKATEVALEREVAIKVMNVEMASTPGAFDRFRREARVAAALSHPHIVPIYAIGEDPSLAWFAMKYIEGRGLDSILHREGAQPVERVIETIATVGKALHVAHEKGVVHRDVKPANIMVGADGWLYVTDFGIAKRDDAQGLTQAGTVVGTPAYMSPEQFNGQQVTGAADQYALGIVAYEMLAGRTPFDAKSLGEVMRGHLLDPPPPLRARRVDVPVGLADIVNRMLEKDPAKRFPTLAVAVAALDGLQVRPSTRRPATAPGGIPGAPAARPSTPTSSPTTPIPRSNPSLATSAPRRTGNVSQVRPLPAPEPRSSGGAVILLILLLAVGGGAGWYFLAGPGAGPSTPATLAATPALPVPADSGPADPGPAAVPATAESAAVNDTVIGDSTGRGVNLDSAVANLAAQIASAPRIDGEAPPEQAIVRVGSQLPRTVLFVNGEQIGPIGGLGLLERTVAPGPVSIAVKRIDCRDWDTTFTAAAGRRYTFVERSPRC